mmetsp:Transcript_15168/g.21771  ORF Transcript_15168/g.21771 Transcript_15168/m.21771 type:complete len:158 (+) Transcript_15168:657-1130(+)
MPSVGRLNTLGLAVYGPRASDGRYWFNDDGRIDVHGNQRWTTSSHHFLGANIQMRGRNPVQGAHPRTPTRAEEVDAREREQLRRAIAASMVVTTAPTPATASTDSAAGTSASECVICMESINSGIARALACGHVFHRACIERWLADATTCPTCRERA